MGGRRGQAQLALIRVRFFHLGCQLCPYTQRMWLPPRKRTPKGHLPPRTPPALRCSRPGRPLLAGVSRAVSAGGAWTSYPLPSLGWGPLADPPGAVGKQPEAWECSGEHFILQIFAAHSPETVARWSVGSLPRPPRTQPLVPREAPDTGGRGQAVFSQWLQVPGPWEGREPGH